MPIYIPKKKGASNKPHITPKNAQHTPANEIGNDSSLKPFIDWITINLTPPEKDQHDIHDAFWTAVGDPEVLADATSAELKGAVAGFNVAKRVVLASVDAKKKRPTLFVRHLKDQKRISKLRLEFVPVDLGTEGMSELHTAINMIVPDGWEYLVKHGRVTRLDVAVDLFGATMNSIHLQPKKVGHMMRLFPTGELESIYIGKPKSAQTVIYDRSKKRANKGQSISQCVRIERRLKPGSLKLSNLPDIPNPFAGSTLVVKLPGPPSPAKAWEWSMFSDCVERRGLPAALALLPKDRAKIYKAHIQSHQLPAWDPDAIWKGWRPMLQELKIAQAHW